MKNRFANLSLVVLLLIALPLIGVLLAGNPLHQYTEFPPTTQYVEHIGFSWTVFFPLTAFVMAVTAPFAIKVMTARVPKSPSFEAALRFPWWGYFGLGLLALAWLLAWTRFAWLEAWQPFTFSPIWLGYIITINAITFRRTGHCLMLDRPRYFLFLFPLSAAFWWYFEYLNRFVQNWYYVDISSFSPGEYVVYATLPFSTVLPAVLSTKEWLNSFPRISTPLRSFLPVRIERWNSVSLLVFILGIVGLAGLGVWPNYFFPFLWIAPLLIMLSLQALFGQRTIVSDVQHGDWRAVWLPALAGIVCGFLWELWNSQSLAHWRYAVPYVQRFSLFEMPLLGYTGYLPFGLECQVIADLFLGREKAG